LKSCLYPLLETIFWLNPQNRGYNQAAVDYVLFNDEYMSSRREYYVFEEINSTRTVFKKLSFEEGVSKFRERIVSPYGVLFDLHDVNLAYDVEITLVSLDERSEYKNQMLVLQAIKEQFNKLSPESITAFTTNRFLSEEQANQILEEIDDPENREGRIESLSGVEFIDMPDGVKPYIVLRASQLKIVQTGIKVSMNSGYGIFAMPTWVYSNSLIGNSFTCAGKIFGIKLFQKVSVSIIEGRQEG